MRFDILFLAAAAVAVLTVFSGNEAQAQSGSRAFSAPSVISGQLQGGQIVQGYAPGQSVTQGTGYVQGFPQGGTATYVDAPVQHAPEYRPAPGSYDAQVATQTQGCIGCRGKGRVSTGQLAGGCAYCAQEAPIQTTQDYSAVPSCCGKLGQLDIPSLFTPPRYDRAPVGRAVGRPLFGQWQGF